LSGVNFINILLLTFLYKRAFRRFSLITTWLCHFLAKEYHAIKLLIKCWWNWLQESTFYARIFLPIFWRQKIAKPNIIREKLFNLLSNEKLEPKMLMKLTTAINFIKISCEKRRCKSLMKLTPGCARRTAWWTGCTSRRAPLFRCPPGPHITIRSFSQTLNNSNQVNIFH